jgi:enoyl-CoA hydratase/carnithine racemase
MPGDTIRDDRSKEDCHVDTSEVLVTRDGPIVTLTFNRPEARNALTWAMYERLYETCEEVDADDAVRVLILRGAGGKAFVAGTDISQFKAFETAEDGIQYERGGERRTGRLERVKKPVIAQIEGYAVGGGFGIAAASDLRIATPEAKFGAPIARTLGNFAAPASLALLVATVGPIRAREMVITARLISAGEAKTMGLVDQVHPLAELEARARELAARVAEHAPLTLAAVKEATRRYIAGVAPKDLEDLILSCYLSEDFQEGVRAFLEKRKADWKGR